jgi:hypothetical protein
MKKFFLSAIAAVALMTGMGNNADAAFIFGSINFNQTALAPTGPAVNLATVTSFTTNDYAFGGIATDDFTATVAATPVTGSVLNMTSNATLATWSFSDASFGTFAATSGFQAFNFGGQRGFSFTGTFTPGPMFPTKTGFLNNAVVLLTFNQAGGVGSAISSSFTMNVDPSPVPEPASIVMLGSVFGPAVAFGWMYRRRNVQA